MTDLTYCYLHMTEAEIDSLDHLDDPDYWEYGLSDEELQIPSYMVPPDPDDHECLPSNVHVSYPYGDPTKPTHPAAQANRIIDPNSRALYDDSSGIGGSGFSGSNAIGLDGFGAATVNVGMVWKDLALDLLLPVDPVKEEAARAARARRLANGAQHAEGSETHEPVHDDDDDNDSLEESVAPDEPFEGDPDPDDEVEEEIEEDDIQEPEELEEELSDD